MGITVRELFVEGKGVPAFVAVGHDASGQARQIALALAKGVGCTRAGVLECTFQDEADVNLFGEQALWPLFNQALLLSYEVLVEAGVPPELVALEFYASGEAGEIFRKMAVEGMFEQTRHHSPTSQYGTLSRYQELPAEEVKQRMKDTLRDIRNGRFAEEWAREQAGGYPNLKRLRRQAHRHPLNRIEKKIRPLTPR
jgi:ketol-acid reductoisomerase